MVKSYTDTRNFFLQLMLACLFMVVGKRAAHSQPIKDTARFNLLLKAVRLAMDTSTSDAFPLVDELKGLGRKIKIDSFIAKAFTEEGYCNFYAGNYRKAAVIFDSAAMFWKNTDSLNYAKALNNKGNALMYNSEYYSSLLVFFETLSLFEKLHNEKVIAGIFNNIGLVYESLGDWDNALLYGKKALALKIKNDDRMGMANACGNIGNIYAHKEMTDSAIFFQQLSYSYNVTLKNKAGIANALGNIGNAFKKKGIPDSAIAYLSRAIAITQNLGNAEHHANFLNNLAESYLVNGNNDLAYKYALQASTFIPQITDKEFLQEHYKLMYKYYKVSNNMPRAFAYLEKLDAINDSLFIQKINIQNQKLSIEYEYKQRGLKDSLVFQAQVSNSERKATASKNKFIISFLLLLLAISLAAIWYNRSNLFKKRNIVAQQNAQLQEQTIRKLENEKQLLASQAMLKGQEDERSRLARDLHDGLGGLLSGVKHSIMNMKENVVLSGENALAFEKSLGMIDTSMKELRRVAQNMMPEALAKFGLEEALKDYCATASTNTCKITFQSFGSAVAIEKTVEIIIYRIIQELVNNSLKHAAATTVMVQLVKGDKWVTLSVEDNGKGLNNLEIEQAAGSGWSNIKSRVDYLSGNIDIKSEKNTGTSVNIELKTEHQ